MSPEVPDLLAGNGRVQQFCGHRTRCFASHRRAIATAASSTGLMHAWRCILAAAVLSSAVSARSLAEQQRDSAESLPVADDAETVASSQPGQRSTRQPAQRDVSADLGIANCYVVPLEVIPDVEPANTREFHSVAKRFERDWIRILDARGSGFNSYIPGGRDVPFYTYLDRLEDMGVALWDAIQNLYKWNRPHPGGYPFHYRNYVRRLQALHARRNLTGAQSQAAVLRSMRRINIERMISLATLHSIQGIPLEEQHQLLGLLLTHLESRVQNRHRKGKAAVRMFVPDFMSILLDDLPLQKILASQEARVSPPAQPGRDLEQRLKV
ncbi:hypothetical protein WJX73_010070 [Symbiochloris irregularis]|uniref:Uncharacterized protein n=1 Tax=Symbiochloris irregularis TaxID=706552 RepID=A0AAW1NTR1_9CHLO